MRHILGIIAAVLSKQVRCDVLCIYVEDLSAHYFWL